MYTFKENQNELLEYIQSVMKENSLQIEKINNLCTYIDPEFYDKDDPEEKIICNQIQKRLSKLSTKIQEHLQKSIENEEILLSFQYFQNTQAPYEALGFLYGYIQDDEIDRSIQISKIPNKVKDPHSFLLIIDTINGAKLVPWS